MSTPNRPSTGPTLTELLEQIVFADPDPNVQRLKARWEEVQREVQELFETACRDQHEYRPKHHRGCGTPDAEQAALRDLALIRPMLVEEREQRLTLLWQDVYRQVGQVLDRKAAAGPSLEAEHGRARNLPPHSNVGGANRIPAPPARGVGSDTTAGGERRLRRANRPRSPIY